MIITSPAIDPKLLAQFIKNIRTTRSFITHADDIDAFVHSKEFEGNRPVITRPKGDVALLEAGRGIRQFVSKITECEAVGELLETTKIGLALATWLIQNPQSWEDTKVAAVSAQ